MEIRVENIKCNGCANSIITGLKKLEGVTDVQVDVEKGVIHLESVGKTSRDEVIKKLQSLGYPEPGNGSGLTTGTSFISCMIGRVRS